LQSHALIEGQDGYDERSFLNAVKQTVIDLLKNYYETKVKIFLRCSQTRSVSYIPWNWWAYSYCRQTIVRSHIKEYPVIFHRNATSV